MEKAPFDTIASIYDDQFTHTRTGYLQRQLVYLHLEKILKNNHVKRVLELNCGTGADAIWLAERGYDVLATDISAQMIDTAKAKTKELPVEIQNRLTFKTIAAEDLHQLKEDKPFDIIFSNFGGLNCVSPNELEELAPKLKKNLSPEGRLVFVLMSRFCWWETLYFLAKRNWTQAWRRQSETPIEAPLAEGITAQTWYYSPQGLAKLLQANFNSEQQRPIGFFLPPSYLDNAFKRFPKVLGKLWSLEKRFVEKSWPAKAADHFLMEFVLQDENML